MELCPLINLSFWWCGCSGSVLPPTSSCTPSPTLTWAGVTRSSDSGGEGRQSRQWRGQSPVWFTKIPALPPVNFLNQRKCCPCLVLWSNEMLQMKCFKWKASKEKFQKGSFEWKTELKCFKWKALIINGNVKMWYLNQNCCLSVSNLQMYWYSNTVENIFTDDNHQEIDLLLWLQSCQYKLNWILGKKKPKE